MVQYYTLDQAAQILRTTPDQLKDMAKKNEVRAFQDRGTLRFRAPEIDELARIRGLGSDPELPLGEAPPVKPAGSSGGRHTTHAPADVFNFSLGDDTSDEVPLGADLLSGGSQKSPSKGGSGGRKSPTPSKSGPKSPAPGPKSPPPRAGSDSDVRLVMDGSELDFQIAGDSDVQVAKEPPSKEPRSGSGSNKKKQTTAPPADSGVRIVPLDAPSDSDVKIVPHSPHDSDVPIGELKAKTASDSDIRVEELKLPSAGSASGRRRGSADPNITEEIDLDAEARKAEEAAKKAGKKGRPGRQQPALPTSSPFELSESDVDVQRPAHTDPAESGTEDSSSDFELKPIDSLSPLEIDSDEVPKLAGDDEVELGAPSGGGGHASGINLQDPADSGISLEQGGSDEIEFELSLDASATPKPAAAAPEESDHDSSSEFELSLDDDAAASSATGEDSDSEFELSLDVEGSDAALEKVAPDSDSEFELTLDEGGNLAPAEESGGTEDSDEKDIFETDFEVPALDEESGSEAVALDESDTDLESSDFDLALDQEGGEESGSEVVALEGEEEADEGAATVARPRRAAAGAVAEEGEEEPLEQSFEEDLGEGAEEEPEPEPVAAGAAAPAAPTPWGALPAVLLIPTVIVLFLAGVMSFELIQGMWGYHRGTRTSSLVTDGLVKMLGQDEGMPKD